MSEEEKPPVAKRRNRKPKLEEKDWTWVKPAPPKPLPKLPPEKKRKEKKKRPRKRYVLGKGKTLAGPMKTPDAGTNEAMRQRDYDKILSYVNQSKISLFWLQKASLSPLHCVVMGLLRAVATVHTEHLVSMAPWIRASEVLDLLLEMKLVTGGRLSAKTKIHAALNDLEAAKYVTRTQELENNKKNKPYRMHPGSKIERFFG